ncbi:Lrp/AsnC family transcriptional regulator [Kineosporia sp. NBRC 101677]|uniref:Lrp/AsnC family transcriptional regulator n=1 Tax=Kineosporia sp. NBRC 101677 TaxID=3032197 RepID=UPI0025524C98|nr:Lrp/AsnC family transcriptional regulator [Kineosporia sp. NBRC 101677]
MAPSWTVLDDLDLQLLNALQFAPRTSWTALAPVLRSDASTLSRRWIRLTEAGLAWTTCYVLPERIRVYSADGQPLRSSFAVIEIRCEAGRRAEVVAAVAQKPAVLNVECTSGPRELTVNVLADSPSALDRYVADHVAAVPGVVSTSTRFVRTIYREGSESDLMALTSAQRSSLEGLLQQDQGERAERPELEPSPLTERVLRALQPDVRRSAVEVATEAGIPVALARRTIAGLTRSPWVRMRADFAHDRIGWNASVQLWMSVPQDSLPVVAAALSRHPAVRLCASTVSPDNLVATLWMRELDDLDAIELSLQRRFPQARVTDRWMVTRVVKRMGTLFDDSGRRCGYVPVPLPWR